MMMIAVLAPLADPMPTPPSPDIGSIIQSIFTAWNGHAYVLVVALVVNVLVTVAKQGYFSAWLASHLPSKMLPFVSMGLGVLATSALQIQAGVPWTQALINGVLAGFTAIAGHQAVIESLRSGKEIVPATAKVAAQAPPQQPPPPPPPPSEAKTDPEARMFPISRNPPPIPPPSGKRTIQWRARAFVMAVAVSAVAVPAAAVPAGCSAQQWVAFEATAKNLLAEVNLFLPAIETVWSLILPALGANAGDANAAFNKAVVDLTNASAVLNAAMNATDSLNQPTPDLTKLIQAVKDAVAAITTIVDQYGPNAQAKVVTLGTHLDTVHQMAHAIAVWR